MSRLNKLSHVTWYCQFHMVVTVNPCIDQQASGTDPKIKGTLPSVIKFYGFVRNSCSTTDDWQYIAICTGSICESG